MPSLLKSASNLKAVKYQADQQIKYLHLDAEVESLLLELQTLKQRNASETKS